VTSTDAPLNLVTLIYQIQPEIAMVSFAKKGCTAYCNEISGKATNKSHKKRWTAVRN